MYKLVKSLCCAPEMNILCQPYSMKNNNKRTSPPKKKKKKESWDGKHDY